MGTIRTVEARMPAGFRFHPRDDELVLDYLLHRLSGRGHDRCGVAMPDVDLNKCEPWDLPEECRVGEGNEWYFFSLRDRKYTTGDRTNRATRSGYWKATGKDRAIAAAADESRTLVGMRKTLVFYRGRAPRGRKTEWVMHEFRLHPRLSRLPSELQLPAVVVASHHHHPVKEDWVLCRVFKKSRTTTPTRPPSQDQASTPSCQPADLPAVVPPVTATYNEFDDSRTAAEQAVSCFAGLPAMPFRRPAVSLGDLLAIDASEKEAGGIMIGSTISSGLELAPSWELENDLMQIWTPPYNALML